MYYKKKNDQSGISNENEGKEEGRRECCSPQPSQDLPGGQRKESVHYRDIEDKAR